MFQKSYEQRVAETEELLGPSRAITRDRPGISYELSVGVMITSAILALAAAIKEAGEKK